MADAEAKKILAGRWADSGDRTDPDDTALTPPLDRSVGYPASFSGAGGNTPRRPVVNQRFRELDGVAYDTMTLGVLPYDAEIDYPEHAIVQVDGTLHSALVANGPTTMNVTHPTATGQTAWGPVTGQQALPAAPTGFVFRRPESGRLHWAWGCPSDGGSAVVEFEFQIREQGVMSWPTATSLTVATTEISGLVNGTTYEVRARARNALGWGPWSAVASASPAGTVPDGSARLALQGTAANNAVDLTWLEPLNGGYPILFYRVQWRTAGQMYDSSRQQDFTATNGQVTSLANGTEYFFRVTAFNLVGGSNPSNEVAVTPAPAAAVPSAPAAPTGTPGNGAITWAWMPSDDNGADITEYGFQTRPQGSTWPVTVTSTNLPVRIETGLTNGVVYEARVRAVNSEGAGPWSPTGSATPAAEVPDQIQRVGLVPGDEQLVAAWGVPEANGAALTGYQVQHANNGSFVAAATINVAVGTTATTITGLTNGTVRHVRARAVNAAGNGPWSPGNSAAPDDGIEVPGAPGTPVATAFARALSWRWGPANQNGSPLTRYEFQSRQQGSAWPSDVVALTEAGHTLMGLTGGTTYEARVRATNSDGTGPWSGTGSGTAENRVPVPVSRSADGTYDWPWGGEDSALMRVVGGSSADTVVTVGGQTYRANAVRAQDFVASSVTSDTGSFYVVDFVPRQAINADFRGSDARYLARISYLYGFSGSLMDVIFLNIYPSQTSNAFADLSTMFERSGQISFSDGVASIAIAGPNHIGNMMSDDSSAYVWQPPNNAAVEAFFQGAVGRTVTVRFENQAEPDDLHFLLTGLSVGDTFDLTIPTGGSVEIYPGP